MTDLNRLLRAPWGLAWNAVSGPVAATSVPRPATTARQSLGAALMQPPGMPQDDPSGFKSRIGAAIQGLGSQLDPNGGGVESFLSGLTGGYSTTQQGLTERAEAPYRQRQAQEEQALRDRLTGAQANYYNAQAYREMQPPQLPTAAVLRDNWVDVHTNPGEPQVQKNTRTGETRTVIGPNGRPMLTPRGTPRAPATKTVNGRLLQQQPNGTWKDVTPSPQTGPSDDAIDAYLRDHPNATNEEIAAALGGMTDTGNP